jgi:hypothetical protein
MPYIIKDGIYWNLKASYNESLDDNNPYEGRIYNSKSPVFPYDLKDMYAKMTLVWCVQLLSEIIY